MSSTASAHSGKEMPSTEETKPSKPATESEDGEQEFKPMSLKFWSIISGTMLAMFIVLLDRTIIAPAVPRITDEFDSIQDIGWYGSSYMLTCACLLPISGRVYKLYSTKWVFLSSIVIFEVGSALCGAAPNSTAFIVGRAIAGLGAACIISGAILIIIPLVPLHKRPVFNSMNGLVMGLASVLGPIIGGLLTDHVTWRWCFYLNLPIGGFAFLVILLFLHVDSPKRDELSAFDQVKRLDPIGIVLLVPSITCLILALQWGGSSYSWSNPKVIGVLVTFAVLFIAFIVVEVLTPDTAMAPTRVVLNRSVAGSMFFLFLLSGSLMSVLYYLTIWFQAVKDDSPTHAGVSTIPLILSFILMGIVAAVCTQKIGYYVPPLFLGSILCSVGAGMLSKLSPSSNHSAWIGYQVLFGFGVGCGFQTSMLPAQTVLSKADVPMGMALMFFTQQLGGSVFLAVSQNIFSTKLVKRLSGVAGLDTNAIVNSGVTTLRSIVPSDKLGLVISAYNYALTRVFILATAISAFAILGALAVEWKSIKKEKNKKVTSVEDQGQTHAPEVAGEAEREETLEK